MSKFLIVFALGIAAIFVFAGVALANKEPPAPEEYYLVTKPNPKEINVITKFGENEQLIWSFNKKDWGTWNIFWLSVTDNTEPIPVVDGKNRRDVAGGGTDWEYVWRGGPKGKQPEWMGGNHGNERLVSLTLEGDGEILDPVKDLTKEEDRIFHNVVIREETRLTNPGMEGDIAAIVREYSFVPGGLRLKYTVEWLQDVRLDIGYAQMFPVSKTYGRHFRFGGYDKTYSFEDNKQSGVFRGFVDSIEAFFWGDAEPNLRLHAFLTDKSAVLDYKYTADMARVWDVTANQVKLYFAQFSNKGATSVAKGTKWIIQSGWDIYREGAK
ncbi:MAG: hypothetical protein AB1700_02840 [Bacillota bacterium]